MSEGSDLNEVSAIQTQRRGPVQIAVQLSQLATRIKNPVVGVVCIMEFADERIEHLHNTDLDAASLSVMAHYLTAVAIENVIDGSVGGEEEEW